MSSSSSKKAKGSPVLDGRDGKKQRLTDQVSFASVAQLVFDSHVLTWYEAIALSQASKNEYEIWAKTRDSYPDFTNLLNLLNIMNGTNTCRYCGKALTFDMLQADRCQACGQRLTSEGPLALYNLDPRLKQTPFFRWSHLSLYQQCKELVRYTATLVSNVVSKNAFGPDRFLDPSSILGFFPESGWSPEEIDVMERLCPGRYTFFMKAFSLATAQFSMETNDPLDFFLVLVGLWQDPDNFSTHYLNMASEQFTEYALPENTNDTPENVEKKVVEYIRKCYPSKQCRQVLGPVLVLKLYTITPYYDYIPLDEEDGNVTWPAGYEPLTAAIIEKTGTA